MNLLFERFVAKYLRQTAPSGVRVYEQETRPGLFVSLTESTGWRALNIRPDLVIRDRQGTRFVADTKYKDLRKSPPSRADLYQLTVYGLGYDMDDPREVFLFYPLAIGDCDSPRDILFRPAGSNTSVLIKLRGVPIERLLQDDSALKAERAAWWFAA